MHSIFVKGYFSSYYKIIESLSPKEENVIKYTGNLFILKKI